MGMDFRDFVWNRCGKWHFDLKVGQDLKNPEAHPQKEFSGVPSPPRPLTFTHNDIYSLKALVGVLPSIAFLHAML